MNDPTIIDRMLGADCAYTGKGDGPYTIERDEYRNIYSLYRTNSDGQIMRPYLLRFEANDFGIDTAATARAMCWFLNERDRMRYDPTRRAYWLPGGPKHDEQAHEARVDAEDAARNERELQQWRRDTGRERP